MVLKCTAANISTNNNNNINNNNNNVELQNFAAVKYFYVINLFIFVQFTLRYARSVKKCEDFIPDVCPYASFTDIPTWRGNAIFPLCVTAALLVWLQKEKK
jgi:hypothetical protein